MTHNTPQRSVTIQAAATGSTWMVRLKPYEDLVDGLVALCHAQKIHRATVVAGLGSLMYGNVVQGDIACAQIEGPGVEILAVSGWIDIMHPQDSVLQLTLGDRNGKVTVGRAVKGRNPVCVTVELVLQEWTSPTQPRPADVHGH